MFGLRVTTFLELLCFLTALATVRTDKKPLWRISLTYMFLVCLTELVVARWAAKTFHNNLFVYNIYTLFEGALISAGIYHCLKAYTNPKKIIIIGLVIFYSLWIVFFLMHGIMTYNSWAGGVLSALIMLYCCYYYYFVLTDNAIMDINTNPEFWWVTGVLFFYFGTTTANLFHELFTSIMVKGNSLRNWIFTVLNIIFYSILAYSFICRSKQRKLQS
ncbi:hypothetical protein [Pedobacter sp. BMA]|uniref:hypothetical protein n=1 Tax=Pedobacter sp. BMA TaxID=1663685 RepID=UPI00064A4996|nr:hypothetical protein [Pedobacter sp. BMA]KLT64897.1 hypothetical protein AB669_14310 [Pedobacter sp. BMA]